MTWLDRIADKLLFDFAVPGRSRKRETPPSPDRDRQMQEAAYAMLAAANPQTIARVSVALETAKLEFTRTAGARDCSVDVLLGGIRPLLQQHRPGRVPSLARLAWIPVEPLLTSGSDARPWSIHRGWLRPAWLVVSQQAPDALAELGTQLAELATGQGGTRLGRKFALPEERLGNIARAAQDVALGAIESAVASGFETTGPIAAMLRDLKLTRDAARVNEAFSRILQQLASSLAARIRGEDAFLALGLAVEDMLTRPGWRDRTDLIDELQHDYGSTVRLLGRGRGQAEAEDTAAAFLVLLGRSVTLPWPLLEAMRRRTYLMQGAEKRPVDTRTTADVAAFVDDLVAQAERIGASAISTLDVVTNRPGDPGAAFSAARATAAVSAWLHGLLSVGFLDVSGPRHRRIGELRDALASRMENALIPSLRAVVGSPLAAEWDERSGNPDVLQAWGVATAAALHAVEHLQNLANGADGLRCSGLAAKAMKESLQLYCVAGENLVSGTRAGRPARPERVNAVLRIANALSPGMGSSFRRRLDNSNMVERAAV
ncbi:hypothetical protein [Arenibaculum pallidiluteum]|uniref:hypothetical protein n=1 Tax=Arenibaculum pallidiluteum TaxID=2812559 RepID=UPI001A95B230|nr:hypothetical protein [Arenibaculum pallidiluteum]